MMLNSPVVRQAILCQSAYFFSLAQKASGSDISWETVLVQTGDAFDVLLQALQIISSSSVSQHLCGAVRIMAAIMQVQRFEVAISSFNNCQAHLRAVLDLFKQLMDTPAEVDLLIPGARFNDVLSQLGPSPCIQSVQSPPIPRAERAAFRF